MSATQSDPSSADLAKVSTTVEENHASDNDRDEAEKNFKPRSPQFWLIIMGVYASVFLVGLDRTIIATAIPRYDNKLALESD
jgi:hypothetical protein